MICVFMREQLIREVEIVPLEVVVRNVAAGSLSQRLGIEEGTQLPRSIIEFYYKNDQLNDPMVSEEHITAFGWATPQEIDDIMPVLPTVLPVVVPVVGEPIVVPPLVVPPAAELLPPLLD